MRVGPTRECREHGEQVRALCRQLLVEKESTRLAAYGGLIILAPGHRDLTEFLRSQRHADTARLFVHSLRLDVAIQAVKELAADLLDKPSAQGGEWTEKRVFNRLSHLIFGQTEGDRGGIAGRLHDTDRYRRSRRTEAERELIELLDEALQRRDDVLRNEAFGRLWSWAVKRCHVRCNDPDFSQDLASEAIVHLLRTAVLPVPVSKGKSRPVSIPQSLENFLPLSGVEILSRTHVALFGFRTQTGGWIGLLGKHVSDVNALKEVPLDLAAGDRLYAPLAEVGDSPPVKMSRQQIRDALDVFRGELQEKRSFGSIGPKSAQALSLILDHVQVHMLAQEDEEHDAMAVVNVRLRPAVEAQTLRPYLATKLGIKRPKSLLHRLLAVTDILTAAQLYDRHLAPLPINKQDLPKILDRLRNQIAEVQFRKTRRQRQTVEALIEFWEDTRFAVAAGDADRMTIRLPPLLSWSETVHVQTEVVQVLKDELGMHGTSAHNCVKGQLGLLDTWGFLKELRDE